MPIVSPSQAATFVELLSYRASIQPEVLAFRYLSYPASGVEEQTITYQELDARARVVAQHLLTLCKPGDRALMLYPSGIDFIVAYFGCLYAGVIAVPGYPPKRNQKLGRLRSLVEDCQAKIALTDSQTQQIAQSQFSEVEELKALSWLITDTVTEAPAVCVDLPQPSPADIAFLQYTSGSTGDPKGVMVTHGNLIANSRSIYAAMGHGDDAVIVGWLPLFHDMGLIGNLLQPIYIGCSCTFMSPASFLQRPARWLEAISTYRATTSGGPNFGYDLCVASVKDAELAQLDLRSWRVAFNGAEPIRPESIDAFSKKFAACGFDHRAHYACYGMAETTLLITGGEAGRGTIVSDFDDASLQKNRAVLAADAQVAGETVAHPLVNCGVARGDQGVLIVDPASLLRCADGEVGEVWVYGDSNAKGYWQKPEASNATFAAYTADRNEGPYLRTGDLGFMHDGGLYIAGRLKDVVIIRGMNHYPQDIEMTAFESDQAFMPNGAAVFTITEAGQEQLVVVLEVRRTFLRNFDPQQLARVIQQAVVLQHELQIQSIVFIKPGHLPKTSSGKVQRQACKLQYLANEIEELARVDRTTADVSKSISAFDKGAWSRQPQATQQALLANHLAEIFEAYAKFPAGSLQRDVPYIGYGLDSLALTQIAARVGDDLDCTLQVQHMFSCETIDALAVHLQEILHDPASRRLAITSAAVPENRRYPLSYAQQRMWFLMQMESSSLYNISGLLRIRGRLNVAALDRSFREIMRRHDALRTRFVEVDFQPYQVVRPAYDWKLSLVDLSDRSAQELQVEIDRDLNFVFNLSEDILFRTILYKEAHEAYTLSVCMHHIIADGWSVSVLLAEVAALYAAYNAADLNGAAVSLPSLPLLPIQYPDYAVWQRDYLQGEVLARQEQYWKTQLSGVAQLLLPTDKIRPTTPSSVGHSIAVHLDPNLTEQLQAFSKANKATLYMTLLTAFGALLHKYSGQDDICIGTPIANRTLAETKNLIGFFVNTLALRTSYAGTPSFLDVLQQVKTVTVGAYAHQDLPFEKVVDLLQVERDLSTSPLFQVMFVLQEAGSGTLALPELEIANSSPVARTAKFDLTLELQQDVDGLRGTLAYKTDLFEAATIARMATHFERLLKALVSTPDASVGALSLLDDAEKNTLLGFGSMGSDDAFAPVCSHLLFEAQAQQTPDALALQCDGASLTYQALNQRANQLAHYLVAQGVKPDALVGICIDRSLDMVVALLGILKAGGAYVAFDPTYPAERLRYLLEDSGVDLVLTQSALTGLLPLSGQRTLLIDQTAQFAAQSTENIAPTDIGLTPASLAYVIYTSGSTGNPKASLLMHQGLSNLAQAQKEFFRVQPQSRVIQFASFAFDAATSEIFMALCAGATLHIVAKDVAQSGAGLSDYVAQQQITHATLPPALLSVLDKAKWASVTDLVVAGEHCPIGLVREWAQARHFYNAYGPSETTVCSSIAQLNGAEPVAHMGKPMRGVQLAVLDASMQALPPGVAGQLFVGGRGVGRGYLNRAALNQEKFVDNPFGEGKLYATGDLVRWLNDGNLEFIGRLDNQVKIRGFRIELGEIETVLSQQAGVADSVVVAHADHDGSQRLVAYVVAQDAGFSTDDLRAQLQQALPSYMVPALFMLIERLPLTANGKVDKKALPKPDLGAIAKVDYVAPRNATEQGLAAIWAAVLQLEQVGVHHDFFELGGHSLLVIQVISRIKQAFGVQLKVVDVFGNVTIAALANCLQQAGAGAGPVAEIQHITPAARDQSLLLSYAQQRMWIVNQIDANTAQYNMPGAIDFNGALDIVALESALQAFVARHEIVRTVYAEREGVPYQVIRDEVDFSLRKVDLTGLTPAAQQEQVASLSQRDALTPFDLSQDVMLRATLLSRSGQHHTLLITIHHIASDGWSTALLVREINELYNAFVENRAAALPALSCQYADYASWQRKNLAGAKLKSLLAYWTERLADLPTVHSLPLDHARPALQSYAGAAVVETIAPQTVAGLRQLAQDQGATLFMVLHAAFAGLLHRYSGENDIVIGTPIANRDLVELEPLVGLFVNTLVLRSEFSQNARFVDVLAQSKARLLDAYEHQALPFEMLVNAMQVERSQRFNPLFQVMLAYQSGEHNRLQFSGLGQAEIQETAATTKFDLTLNVLESDDGIRLTWEYATDLFEASTIRRLCTHFARLLSEIVAAPAARLGEMPLLSDDETQQLLVQWNDTAIAYPTQKTLHQLFEAQVAQTPDRIALVFEDVELSYAELNRRANQLAHYLRSRGVGADMPVGICVERSIEMVVGLYAILKAGGAYVPFDPAYPKDRLAYMIEDANPPVLLTQQHLLPLLPAAANNPFCLDTQWSEIAQYPQENLAHNSAHDNLAYIIYTSGSTGRPKGVAIEHAGIVNRLQWMQQEYRLTAADRVLQKTPFSFDVSVWEFFWPLIEGATLVVAKPGGHQDVQYLSELIDAQSITTMHFVPPMLEVFLSEIEAGQCRSLRQVMCSGQALPLEVQNRFFDILHGVELHNLYGPTEASVDVTYWQCRNDSGLNCVPIGKPIANIQIHILDTFCNPVPLGVAGELHIAGIGLARGYLNRPGLTAEKFIPNPFSAQSGARMYKSGDLVRYLADGNIEYLGRIDDQVKIRGFRIELGEIESALAALPGIRDVIVLARELAPGDKRLVAYLVPHDSAAPPATADLRAALLQSLPDYMVPAYLVFVDSMPLTTNGKVDRKALPAPDMALSEVAYVAPRNPTEVALAQIWEQLLGRPRIGVHQNFFDLGGHSLLAIQAISRIKQTFGVQLKVAELFVHTTIETVAQRIVAAPKDEAALPPVVARASGNVVPLTLEQQGYWFLYELEGGTATYNIPTAIRLTGALDAGLLEKSFNILIQRHESLRTVLLVENGTPAQKIIDCVRFTLLLDENQENRYKEILDNKIEVDARYVFDLKNEVPIRAVLHSVYRNDHVLTILLHHTMADGWSQDIFMRELALVYNALVAGSEHGLAALPVQYGDYALWQKQHLSGAYFESEVAYWRETLQGLPPLLDLPTDFPRPPVQSYRGKEVKFVLPFALTQNLVAFSRKHNATLFNTLLSGLNVLLSRYGRSDDIAIGTAIANRSQPNLESLIGCFANTLVLRTKVEQHLSFAALVERVNGVLFDAFDHASIPFDVVVDAVQPVRNLGVPPIFQVMFRLHNQRAGQGIVFDGLSAETVVIESESAKLDLNFSLVETEGRLEGVIEYATDLFSEDSVRRIARHFQLLLESAMADSNAAIESLNLLSREELTQVEQWNNTRIAYPQDQCVYHLFEHTAARVPDKLAYICGAERFSYAELNAQANRLAHYLQSLGVTLETRVGLSVERSAWAGISTLAIFKSGGTYVPLDPKYPAQRLEVMRDVVRPKVILTLSSLADKFAGDDAQIICLDQIAEQLAAQSVTNPAHSGAEHSAYILFTSGTTGRPKAILVSHKSFRNMVVSHEWARLHAENSKVLQFASLSFSISLWDSFMAWVPGGTLVSVTQEENLPGEPLYELLAREQITHATWPVSLLSTLPMERIPHSLQTVISSAEPCNDAVVARWTQRGCRFLNMYGNSEVSLGSTLYEYNSVGQKLTIGVAFPNTRMYLLDKYLRQVPIGVIAEIHTAGAGLATCYWNNPQATAASFIPNPFALEQAERIYKTGDLGRYLPNGEIEFIGREDFQVSIRGFRVELTEIEDILRGVPDMADVVVVSQLDANKVGRLVCFYVEKENATRIDVATLRQLVSSKLPSYMVPSLFVRLDAMPLTPNRKVDRLGLPTPSLDDEQGELYVAPGNALEVSLAAIWSEVLGLPQVGVNRNFFEIGGHSLLAVQVVARIKEQLALPLTIKDLFVYNSIETLATFLSTQTSSTQLLLPTVTPRSQQGLIPLSLDQKPYWFLHQLEGGSYTYNLPFAMRLTGTLDVAALEQSFVALLNRHEALRTVFPVHDGEPAQQILSDVTYPLVALKVGEAEVEQYLKMEFTYIFDLAKELPIRMRLLQVAETQHVVTLVMHHAVADGWSLDIVMRELTAFYESFSSGSDSTLAPLSLQYGDYSQWQHENVVGDYYANQVAFWKAKLAGLAPLLNLPLDYARPPVQSYRGKEHAIALPFSLTTRLNQFARQHNTTLYNVLLSGLAILLSRYGRTDDIPVGTAIANRPQKELEPLIGCFANTLVIRCRVNPKENFQKLVAAVGNEALDAFSHGSVPFDGVVEAVQPERSLGVPPIFQVMFRLHNQRMAQTDSFGNLRSELLEFPSQSAKLDLNFSLVETDAGLKGVIEYATDIFSEQTVQRIGAHYQTILEAAIKDSTLEIEKLSVLTRAEMAQVQQWNTTEIDYPKTECMHHLFERAVQRTPNKLAYVCGDDRFTYTELNARANRLAHFLQSRGVGPEVRVGISVERSTWAGIGALAVFKAGGTYVPLDANYPKDRINNMLDVAKPAIILTLASIKSRFDDSSAEIVCLDTEWESIQSQPVVNPAAIGAEHSAYILFTSGTTGKPKGILISHRSFRNVAVTQRWAGLHSNDSRVLQFASLSFSIALWGAFMAWVPGGTLYSVTAKQNLPDEPLFDLLEEAQITHVTWPVSLLSTIPIERMPASLRTVISSAEPCNDAVVEKWTKNGCRFLNLYGNSEVSLGSTLYEYHKVGEKLTIGKALPNTQMYLLDENLKQVPIGVIAEIHTAGVGLATCYVDDPAATAKSFIANPFSKAPGARLYKTGDLGRYLPNGEIEFIGREDFQVSIRGFRVELSEIEDVLRTVAGVLEVVVVSRNDQQGLARLVCFYTQAKNIPPLSTAHLRKTVGDKLPNYMVPSMFIALDAMPLTPNRKIDRMALPQASAGDAEDVVHAAPVSPTEKTLATIWSTILDVQEIGIRQDFFELGGHSLLATKIVARIRSECKVDLSLQQFFENSTIERLAALIAQSRASYVDSPITILLDRENVPLSFAQQRLWFLDRYEENSNFYHMPSVMKIVGDLNLAALEQTFATIVERHEVLRTNFVSSNGQAYQKINRPGAWHMAVVELEGATMADKEQAFGVHLQQQLSTSFNLETDALLRVTLYQLDAQEYRLFINMHHIVSDGWSITVLTREIVALYEALANGQATALPTLPVQYADYSAWQATYLQGAILSKQSQYWRDKLKDISTLPLPLDFERPKNQTYHGDRVNFALDQSVVEALEALGNQHGATLFMTMLTAFNVLLSKYAGHNDISIGTPIANRVRAEVEPLIGFFANTLVLRADLDGNPEFSHFLQQVKQTTLEAYSHQDLPFEKVVDLVLPERDPSRSPLFQVSFSMQSFPETSFTLPGIRLENVPLENKSSKFDLLLELSPSANGISGQFEYNTDLFLPATIQSYVDSFVCLLHAIVADPSRKLSQLSLSSSAARTTCGILRLADYPLLQALYGNAVDALDTVGYCLYDDNHNAVPNGACGRLQLLPSTEAVDTQFIARHTANGLMLLGSDEDVAYVDHALVYPRAVEQSLMKLPGIRDCHVAARQHPSLGQQLVAYLVCDGEAPQAQALTQHLRDADAGSKANIFASVKLTALPLTRSGKVDNKRLQKYAVHSVPTHNAWIDKIKQLGNVEQAIVVTQSPELLQSAVHLDDLLPATLRGQAAQQSTAPGKSKKSGSAVTSTVPAIVMGAVIQPVAQHPVTLVDVLRNTAARHGQKPICFYHADGKTTQLSYAELLHKAQRVLTGLRAAGLEINSKVIFQFDDNEDFVVAFWACALGGFIPVPIAAAKDYRKSNAQTVKVAHAWNMMDPAVVLAGANVVDGVQRIGALEGVADFKVLAIAPMFDAAPASDFHDGATDDVALIMLTSGSTGLPKGVQLSHANLIGRTLGSAQKNGFHADMVSLNWMALDHVGGIIYFHIRDTYLGAQQLQVATDYILADPLRWLQLIDKHRVNVTWAPNFAFSLIVDKHEALNSARFDLSCIQFMLNGAEAVVPKTTQSFISLMQRFGMAEDSVKPVYGMSEISSGITYAKRLNLTYGSDDAVFVSVGGPVAGVNLRVVDENDQVMMEGQSGRLQISGVTVTKGYLGGADVNQGVFTEDGWFKTGDLAFLDNGELTITGREKDVIIINGVNFYSHEIEAVVEEVPGVVVSYTGACAVRRGASNSDQLALFFHTAQKGDAVLALIKEIRKRVLEKIGVAPSYVVPVEKDKIPKTEIGKIQLSKLAQSFQRGEFNSVLKALDIAEQNEHTLPDWFFSKTWVPRHLDPVRDATIAGVTLVFADESGCAESLELAGQVITVNAGHSFVESGDRFEINVHKREHYDELLASLAQRGIVVQRVVNLLDYDVIDARPETLFRRARLTDGTGLYSAWYLAQAFASTDAPPPMRWIWAARNAQALAADDGMMPDRATNSALLKTLNREYAWLSCRHIDFSGDDVARHAQQLAQEVTLVQADEVVAYRQEKRFVLRLQKEHLASAEKSGMPIAAGAGYLISGGLGGIAYELAKLLLKQFNAKLLLVGRTPVAELSAAKQDMLDDLNRMGSVQYADVDICNHAAVEAAVESAEAMWQQKLGGVFHLAGVAQEQMVAEQSLESLHNAMRAKTLGTRILYAICNQRSHTLFVNFSSVNGYFGGAGMAAYSIANHYQASFIESVQANKNVNSYCLSWSLWHDTGMGSQYKQVENLSRAMGFKPIMASKGMLSMLAALHHEGRQLLIGLDDTKANVAQALANGADVAQQLVCYVSGSAPDLVNTVATQAALQDEFGMALTPHCIQVDSMPTGADGAIDVEALRRTFSASHQVKVEKVAPRDEIEATLVKIATDIFGAHEPIGVKDNFFDVGANSLLIVKMHHEIQLALSVEFPMVELFNSTTVEKLAAFLSEQGSKTGGNTADAARAAGQDRRAAMQRRNQGRNRKRAV